MKSPNPWLILLNDFCHDLFTGLWFGSFITLAVLRSKAGADGLTAIEAPLLSELIRTFTALCLINLGLIVMTGIFRFVYYRNWDGAGMKDVKKKLLIIKHAVLGTAFLAGTFAVVYWSLT